MTTKLPLVSDRKIFQVCMGFNDAEISGLSDYALQQDIKDKHFVFVKRGIQSQHDSDQSIVDKLDAEIERLEKHKEELVGAMGKHNQLLLDYVEMCEWNTKLEAQLAEAKKIFEALKEAGLTIELGSESLYLKGWGHFRPYAPGQGDDAHEIWWSKIKPFAAQSKSLPDQSKQEETK